MRWTDEDHQNRSWEEKKRRILKWQAEHPVHYPYAHVQPANIAPWIRAACQRKIDKVILESYA